MSLGCKLKYLRECKNIKQNDLAKYLGVTQKAVSNYENDMRIPDLFIIKKIAKYFNVSADYLLSDEKEALYDNVSTSSFVNETFGDRRCPDTIANLKHLPLNLIQWVQDKENAKYIKLAKKIKETGIDPKALEKFLNSIFKNKNN